MSISSYSYPTLTIPFHESPILYMQVDKNRQFTWLAGTCRHFRHELRRFARLLNKETGCEPKLVRRTNPDSGILKKFYELEAAGWKGKEASAIQPTLETQVFYEQIAKEAAARGYFCPYTLETNGEMIAGAFSVETKGRNSSTNRLLYFFLSVHCNGPAEDEPNSCSSQEADGFTFSCSQCCTHCEDQGEGQDNTHVEIRNSQSSSRNALN